ncbi:MAG: DNA internalization-related competence protein ComEC/Rec2 [Candidatus Omnitrophica bacterium CG11_big_fil_rev_8_21_14_0_20_63_9]|nr:MAG: DNA internalization-related competence protein ComEC/Rec2 [Candidatus Omnitrophica bacterium CG11_big_fil_rev_8_21_14_0_20_63_9]
MRAPFVSVALAFICGLLAAAASQHSPVLGVCAGSLAAVVGWALRAQGHRAALVVLLLWGMLGALRMVVWQHHPEHALFAHLSDEPRPVQLHGIVVDDPSDPFTSTELGMQTCVVELRHVRRASWEPLSGRVRVTWQQVTQPLAYGDEVLLEGVWTRVPPPGNIGQFDWRAYLARQRVQGLLRVRPYDAVVVLQRDRGSRWMAAVVRLRQRWSELLRRHFPERHAGLLRSILLGQRVALDTRLQEAFVETGTIHLLVISGFNVGIIAVLLELLLRLTGLPWRTRLPVIALGVAVYSALTGLQPPVVRAALMAWIVLGASALDRVISWPNTLAAAALAILLIDPVQLFDPSFQLSFGAVASLLAFTGPGQGWLMSRLGWVKPEWLRRYVALSVSATASIWIGLWPVLAWYFFMVSPVSMLANVLLAPLISALVVAGTGLLMAATVLETVMRWGSGMLGWWLELTITLVFWCHAIPGGHAYVGRPPIAVVGGYYALLALSLFRARWGWSRGRVAICWAAAAGLWAWSAVIGHWLDDRWLRLEALDVGHGDSILVRTPGGQTLLVDAGTEEAGRFRVLPTLRARGITTLDALLLTHTDADHVGGAVPLLQELRVRRLLTNGVPGRSAIARRVERLARARRIPIAALRAGASLSGDPLVAMSVLHPPPDLVPDVPAIANDNSIVLKVSMGTVSFLLTGDLEEAGVPVLLESQAPLRSTVLKVPHHGSRLGEAGERLFQAVSPQLAILSVGRAHHLPAEETLQALRHVRATVYSTQEQGAIRMRTDGQRISIQPFRAKR